MLNTQKLLYILPELAYIAELLPDKKPHTFSIQSFTQVNGELFTSQESFSATNVTKLMSKLEKGEEYHLILPDFLFTNTIVTLRETSEAQIKEELQAKILPSLGVTTDSHYIETFVLNELRGSSRIQIAAIEKELMLPIKVAASEAGITISGMSPLSWSIKALVSLEPSIAVVQLGSHLFTSEHYIGVDQSTYTPVDQAEAAIETIKTLKGAEASIQTVYLIANSVVEKQLKDALSDTLPLQQMVDSSSDDDRMPSYVKTAIEAGMRTLSIKDYPVPIFHLGKVTAEDKKQFEALLGSAEVHESTDDANDLEDLPKPDAPKLSVAAETQEKAMQAAATVAVDTATAVASELQPEPAKVVPAPLAEPTPVEPTPTAVESSVIELSAESEKTEPEVLRPETPKAPVVVPVPQTVAAAVVAAPVTAPTPIPASTPAPDDEIDLSQFAQPPQEARPTLPKDAYKPAPVIKNKSGVGHMIKMILITIGVLLATVALGVGIALAYIHFATPTDDSANPAVEVSATPTPTPEPVATPEVASSSAELPDDLTILVVNATTKAGYAGTIKTKIEAGDVGTVTAGNAKSTYTTKGNFVFMKEKNAAVVEALEKATALTFTENADAAKEDATAKYDVVVVLAE